MSKDSRVERKKEKANLEEKSKASLNKAYYWVIAFLFLVLILLVFFIFTKSEDKVDLDSNEESTEKVEENKKELEEKKTSTKKKEIQDEEQNESSEEEQDLAEETEETEGEVGEEVQVTEDAAHDPEYATDFSDGSADRLAIKKEIMNVTNLDSDLIEYWVGNDGPARVSATVTSFDKSEVYELHLQYGDGKWQVLNYKELDSLPEEFN